MTKAVSNGNFIYDEGKYVYYVDLSGIITGIIVADESNGNSYINYGIRPVIVISKANIK